MVEKDHFCAIEVVKGTDDSMVPGKASSKPVPALQLSRSIDVTTIADSDEPVFPQHRHHLSGKRKVIPRRNLNKLSTPEGIDVILKDGDITQEQADVLVNTCGSDFKLTGSGGVANAFGVAGGPKLQQYCADLGTASKGSVMETDPAGILKCKSIYHAVTPSTSSNGEQKQAISQIMSKCFQMMTGDNYDSIAFPAIGTGNLNYPRKLVAAEMYNEVFKFSQRYLSSVKKVYFVAFDQQTIQAFNDELSARQDMSNPSYRSMSLPGKEAFMVTAPSPGQQRMVVGPITVEVQRGDITAENTDIIVNCCSGNIGQGGGVTNAIMSAGGSAVKQACAAYTNQPKGSVCETVSGKLSCKKLYHLVNTTASQLGNSIVKCLTMAENSGMTSIAFPAAGTGSHGIPLQDCADAIFDGIKSFVQQCQPRSLKLVRVTVFQQQQLTVFHSAMNSGIPQFSRSKSNPTFTTKK
uniref:Poly [ADP-ribose] polymerase 14-like n=1 Tax=Saccoglossus kowalevskii TaxID=10224 RepID=A0ABM0H068_SACKO